jgi:heme-degrading monooxygenase HmoA
MYSRYTEFQFDADRRDDVYRFWETIAVPSAQRQPGWRAAYILASDEQAGVLRTITVWDAPEDFQRYYASPEHQVLGDGIRASGLRGVARDGLDAWFGEPGEFILLAEWASQEDADRFLTGPDHKAFGAAMDAFGSVVHDRIVGDRIE